MHDDQYPTATERTGGAQRGEKYFAEGRARVLRGSNVWLSPFKGDRKLPEGCTDYLKAATLNGCGDISTTTVFRVM